MPDPYQRYQEQIVGKLIRWLSVFAVIAAAVNSFWFLTDFWGTLLQNILLLGLIPAGWAARRLAERGQIGWAVRLFLGGGMLAMMVMMLSLGEYFILHGAMAFAILALMGAVMDHPRLAWWWGAAAAVAHLTSVGWRLLSPELAFTQDTTTLIGIIAFPLVIIGALVSLAHFLSGQLAASLRVSESARAQAEAATTRLQAELTERERAEERLHLVTTAVEQSSEGILLSDLDGTVQFANPAWARLHGYDDPSDLLGQSVLIFHTPEQVAHIQADRLLAQNGRYSGEVGHVRRDGTTFMARMNLTTIYGQDGRPVSTISTLSDLTAELALREQVQQSQKMEAIGRLAGGVAHDFNNLLTVIISYAELAGTSPHLDDQAQTDLNEALDAARRASDLTQQLLAFSRKQIRQSVVMDLNDTVRDMVKMLDSLVGQDIAMVIDLSPDLPLIKADPGQIGQILVNLVVNARDAMPDGGQIQITTWAEEVDETQPLDVTPGAYAAFAVRDTGVGMDASVQQRLFEPFFTTKADGTGLGLSTSYGIVRQNGGDMIVKSAPGQGSTFAVYLPITEATMTQQEEMDSMTSLGTETVLVVEDTAMVRGVAVRILEMAGYRVLATSGGPEALELVRSSGRPPDLLLTDVMMPGMRGPELAAQLRQFCPGLKVLYTSGYTDAMLEDRDTLLASEGFVQKPFNPQALPHAVRELLDRR